MARKPVDMGRELKKGSVQICILSLIRKERKYGFQLIKELRDLSGGYFDLKEGTLYPALHRMEKQGLVKSEWVTEGTGNPRKYYAITDKGKEALETMIEEWRKLVKACENVLEVRK